MVEKIAHRGIVLLPDGLVKQRAIDISQLIHTQFSTKFALDTETMLPHITVHQFALPARNEDKMLEIVRAAAAQYPPQTVKLTGLIPFLGTGIWWKVRRTSSLCYMHAMLVKHVEAVREGYIIDQHAPLLTGKTDTDIGARRRRMLGNYGNMLSMETFNAHITITSCPSISVASSAIKHTPVEPMSFVATSLHVVEVGPFGSCARVLHSIPFRS